MGGWIALAVGLALLVWLGATYNRLVGLRNKVAEAWSGIDVQLTRRAELVPNLVETVKGYQVHEREVLTAVTEARTALLERPGPARPGRPTTGSRRSCRACSPSPRPTPTSRPATASSQLQTELSTLEEDISFARRYYNAVVEQLNTAVQRIPTVLVAGMLGFAGRRVLQGRRRRPRRAVSAELD
jgi:LemA protein